MWITFAMGHKPWVTVQRRVLDLEEGRPRLEDLAVLLQPCLLLEGAPKILQELQRLGARRHARRHATRATRARP